MFIHTRSTEYNAWRVGLNRLASKVRVVEERANEPGLERVKYGNLDEADSHRLLDLHSAIAALA